jgi:hypothetical protein
MEKASPTAHRPSATNLRRSRPLDYRIDVSERLVVITGEYGDADRWRALLARILQDPFLRPGFAFLRDRRGAATCVDVATVAEMVDAIGRFWPHIKPCRAAILVSRDTDTGALAASELAATHALSIRAFTSYHAAVEWLRQGLTP